MGKPCAALYYYSEGSVRGDPFRDQIRVASNRVAVVLTSAPPLDIRLSAFPLAMSTTAGQCHLAAHVAIPASRPPSARYSVLQCYLTSVWPRLCGRLASHSRLLGCPPLCVWSGVTCCRRERCKYRTRLSRSVLDTSPVAAMDPCVSHAPALPWMRGTYARLWGERPMSEHNTPQRS